MLNQEILLCVHLCVLNRLKILYLPDKTPIILEITGLDPRRSIVLLIFSVLCNNLDPIPALGITTNI